jgi:hypothetical protein
MSPFRRHLRALTLICLTFQAASISALVPRDCCAAHASHASHVSHAAAADGDAGACPMHRAPEREPECSLRGACDGPPAALPLLWSNPAVSPAGTSTLPNLVASPLHEPQRSAPIGNDPYPDPPPPRA